MKAEEPGSRVRVVKYGMGVSEQHRLVERHFTVMQERQLILRLHFAHASRVGPALRAAFDRIGKLVPRTSPPVLTVDEPGVGASDDLRRSLGLS